MSKIGGFLLAAVSVIFGGIMYSLMNWVPIIGPLMVGVFIGRSVKGGVKRAVTAGVLCVVVGVVVLLKYVLDLSLLANILFLWMFVVWHIVCLFFVVVGCLMGSMMSSTSAFFSQSKKFVGGMHKYRSVGQEDEVKTFMICPRCGHSTPEGVPNCSYCGTSFG